MLTPQRYLVVHKDGPKEPTKYFGPFVSETLAEQFSYKFEDKPNSRTFIRPLHSREELDDG